MANLIIQENGVVRATPAVHGEELTITAPCDCSAVTGVQINDVVFPFYDTLGNTASSKLFAEGSLIRVMIDVTNTRAYILNVGDMKRSVYDPNCKAQDVFAYADSKATAVQSNLNTHDSNTTKHITAAERTAWNSKEAGGAAATVQTNLNSHTGNTTVHITAAERNTWNSKLSTETDPTVPAWAKAASKPSYTASEVGAAPSSHTSDTTVHITAAERTAWNSKAEKTKLTSITFTAADWMSVDGNKFIQAVTVTGGTTNSLVALQPTDSDIALMIIDGVNALMVKNDNGSFAAIAIGAAPTNDMTIQATLTEVSA